MLAIFDNIIHNIYNIYFVCKAQVSMRHRKYGEYCPLFFCHVKRSIESIDCSKHTFSVDKPIWVTMMSKNNILSIDSRISFFFVSIKRNLIASALCWNNRTLVEKKIQLKPSEPFKWISLLFFIFRMKKLIAPLKNLPCISWILFVIKPKSKYVSAIILFLWDTQGKMRTFVRAWTWQWRKNSVIFLC